VLSDECSASTSLSNEVRRWLAEGDRLEIARPTVSKPDAFGEGLIEKFRKQGSVH